MNNILLIDADPFMYMDGSKENIEEAKNSIENRLISMLNDIGTTRFILCFSTGVQIRKLIYPDYKANRKADKPTLYIQIHDWLWNNFHCFGVAMLEADDCVSILKGLLPESTVCSIDKDVLHQVVGKNYDFKYRKDENNNLIIGRWVDTDNDDASYFLYKQLLMGDSTDNIKGLKGIGSKKADKILEDGLESALPTYINKLGTVEGTAKFVETFNLVYIKRKLEEVPNKSIICFEEVPVMELIEVEGEEPFFKLSEKINLLK